MLYVFSSVLFIVWPGHICNDTSSSHIFNAFFIGFFRFLIRAVWIPCWIPSGFRLDSVCRSSTVVPINAIARVRGDFFGWKWARTANDGPRASWPWIYGRVEATKYNAVLKKTLLTIKFFEPYVKFRDTWQPHDDGNHQPDWVVLLDGGTERLVEAMRNWSSEYTDTNQIDYNSSDWEGALQDWHDRGQFEILPTNTDKLCGGTKESYMEWSGDNDPCDIAGAGVIPPAARLAAYIATAGAAADKGKEPEGGRRALRGPKVKAIAAAPPCWTTSLDPVYCMY